MGAVLVPLVIIILVLVALWLAGRTLTRGHEATAGHLHQPEVETLRWVVPDGQDAAPVLAALSMEGFEAVHEGNTVLVGCPDGTEEDRWRVRQIIENADVTLEGDPGRRAVRFSDE